MAEPRGGYASGRPGTADAGPESGGGNAINACHDLVGRLRATLSPADLYDDATTVQLRGHLDDLKALQGIVHVATARATAAYSRSGGLDEDGSHSLVHHFRKQGLSARDAHNKSELANNLADATATADALANGEVTEDAAAEILAARRNRRLGDDPDRTEKDLLATAKRGNASDVRKDVKRKEQQRDGDRLLRDAERQHELRRVSLTKQRDGMWRLDGQLTAEAGERAKTLLDSLSTWDPVDTPEEEERTTVQRHADALNDAFDWMLDHRDLPASAGRNRPHVVVTVPHDTVHTDLTDPSADTEAARPTDDALWADLSPGTFAHGDDPVAPQTVRRICCDADLTHVVVDGNGIPLSIGRATRTWSASQRTAITVRDGGCRGPGCDRPAAWTEIHHVRWWRHGGPTDLDNGLLLCRKCHNLVHHGGWTVTLDPTDARASWTNPQGVTIVTLVPHQRRRSTA